MSNGGASVITTGGGQPSNGNLEKRVAALETVLPTLATKADLAELRAEMRTENDKLHAEMRTENDKLRTEMRIDNDKLRAEFRESQNAIILRIDAVQGQLRVEIARVQASVFRWMVATMLTMLVAYSGFFIGLANVLMAHLPSPAAARASSPNPALATGAPRPNLTP